MLSPLQYITRIGPDVASSIGSNVNHGPCTIWVYKRCTCKTKCISNLPITQSLQHCQYRVADLSKREPIRWNVHLRFREDATSLVPEPRMTSIAISHPTTLTNTQ